MALVQIHKWIGGLGNNLEQVAYAYWLARKTGGRFVCNIEHYLLVVPKEVTFGNNIQDEIHGAITNNEIIKRGLDAENERFECAHTVLQELAPTLFMNVPKKFFDGLVVHVRAGNIYKNPSVGKHLIQAPIGYFTKALETLQIKKDILVITNQQHGRSVQPGAGMFPNPMTAEIVRYCGGYDIACHVHDAPPTMPHHIEAVGYLLGAEHAMLTGYTTFSRMLLLANPDLKTVIIPTISGWPHDEISFKEHQCNTHYFDITNYVSEWSDEGVIRQVTHPSNKIRYRGKP